MNEDMTPAWKAEAIDEALHERWRSRYTPEQLAFIEGVFAR